MISTPALVRHDLGPLGLSRPITSTSWTPSYPKQSYWKVWSTSGCPPAPTILIYMQFMIYSHQKGCSKSSDVECLLKNYSIGILYMATI